MTKTKQHVRAWKARKTLSPAEQRGPLKRAEKETRAAEREVARERAKAAKVGPQGRPQREAGVPCVGDGAMPGHRPAQVRAIRQPQCSLYLQGSSQFFRGVPARLGLKH